MKLTLEQWKKANSILRKSIGLRNANVMIIEMLQVIGIEWEYDKNYYVTIKKIHLENDTE